MCGIAALFSTTTLVQAAWAKSMCDAVQHRGPDGEGVVLFRKPTLEPSLRAVTGGEDSPAVAVLGHTRLAIVDLSPAGSQPMERDGCWIVYNGEIYNHVELRKELAMLGHSFRSQSDTEVILAAHRQWGASCLDRLNGMFSFVLVDTRSRKVLAARDRFGVKPLYWWRSGAGFVAFASEIKQFLPLPGWKAVLNGDRAHDFLARAIYDHTDETLFEGVRQVRGGHRIEFELDVGGRAIFDGGVPRPVRWYEVPVGRCRGTFDDAAAEYGRLLKDAVRLRLRADVEVGSCLSGGLDSSAIVCLANGILRERENAGQATFTACADVPGFDERAHAEAVIRATGVRARFVYPSETELFEVLDRLVWHQDEPFGSTSQFAQWAVFRLAARSGIKVMLDGQGADETLGGYHLYFGARFANLLATRPQCLLSEFRGVHARHGYGYGWSLRQTAAALVPRALAYPVRTILDAPVWLNERALGRAATKFRPVAEASRRSVEELSRAQIERSSLPALLHWEDRASMANSVESRVPFLDYRLVELAVSLPEDYKISGGVTKRVLREAVRDIVPESVRMRMDKMGFQTPEEEWMRRQPQVFRRLMANALATSNGVLTVHASRLLDETIAGARPFSQLLWRMMTFGRWMALFDVAVPAA